MQRLRYHTTIKAPASTVSTIMLGLDDKKGFETWTAGFDPDSAKHWAD